MAERGLEEPADMSMDNVTNRLTDCHVTQKERLKDTHIDRQTETSGQFTLSTQLIKPNYQTHRQTDSERDRQTN